ncbi:ATP-grasp domain-containing protein [Yinghuangia sp. YIM S10712]|uniref:ATP-grasp domain-containing protein n=1 Tax=Yinghuangia sp. YIM S10712 TaxID=3436930 RepID=UPI003F5313CC
MKRWSIAGHERWVGILRLCFLIEEQYRGDSMPLDVARHLGVLGHEVDIVEAGRSVVDLDALLGAGHDAWVLKTVSGGPGLTLLSAAAAVGITTINNARSVHAVRDKAIAAALARRHGLPFPTTSFVASADTLAQLDFSCGALVVKPVGGNSGRAVHVVRSHGELARLRGHLRDEGFLIVQPYIPNHGVDYKVYSLGGELHATVRTSPLHPERRVIPREVPLPDDLAETVTRIGQVYGLDLFGVDAVEGPDGWVVVDVNDFPSFRAVPDAVARVSQTLLRLAGAAPGVFVPPQPTEILRELSTDIVPL